MVPPALLACAERPEIPADASTQRAVARLLVALDAAHADCRAKLAAVARLLTPAP